MEFMLLPLSYSNKEEKQESIKNSVDMAVGIEDKELGSFLLAGLLVCTDKIIDIGTRKYIKEALSMTKIGLMYEQEKMEAVRKIEEERQKIEKEKQKIEEEKQKIEEENIEIREDLRKEKQKKEEADREKARFLIRVVENATDKYGVSIADACFDLDISRSEYEWAKKIVDEERSIA